MKILIPNNVQEKSFEDKDVLGKPIVFDGIPIGVMLGTSNDGNDEEYPSYLVGEIWEENVFPLINPDGKNGEEFQGLFIHNGYASVEVVNDSDWD